MNNRLSNELVISTLLHSFPQMTNLNFLVVDHVIGTRLEKLDDTSKSEIGINYFYKVSNNSYIVKVNLEKYHAALDKYKDQKYIPRINPVFSGNFNRIHNVHIPYIPPTEPPPRAYCIPPTELPPNNVPLMQSVATNIPLTLFGGDKENSQSETLSQENSFDDVDKADMDIDTNIDADINQANDTQKPSAKPKRRKLSELEALLKDQESFPMESIKEKPTPKFNHHKNSNINTNLFKPSNNTFVDKNVFMKKCRKMIAYYKKEIEKPRADRTMNEGEFTKAIALFFEDKKNILTACEKLNLEFYFMESYGTTRFLVSDPENKNPEDKNSWVGYGARPHWVTSRKQMRKR